MYSPPYNRLQDRAEALGSMRAHGYALLVTGTLRVIEDREKSADSAERALASLTRRHLAAG